MSSVFVRFEIAGFAHGGGGGGVINWCFNTTGTPGNTVQYMGSMTLRSDLMCILIRMALHFCCSNMYVWQEN